MNKFKNYLHCPFLIDLHESEWFCLKHSCPYYLNSSCGLSPIIEALRKIIFAETEKEIADEEKEEAKE